ncbi:MAG: hypothetical protein ABIO60_08420 [Aquaticitalea sp.]
MKSGKISGKSMFTDENFPVSSSLGLLAYGDIAFKTWRKVKKDTKENEQSQK